MEKWKKPLREDRYRHAKANPSFSSTLLDVIYRSTDDTAGGREGEPVLYRETMRKKQSTSIRGSSVLPEEEMANLQRACLIEQWMEKKVTEKIVLRRKSSTPDFDFNPPKLRNDRNSSLMNSTSSSSDSSCGGGFSSSETDSVYGTRSRSSGLKPVRTAVPVRSEKPPRHEQHHHHHHQKKFNDFDARYQPRSNSVPQQKPKHESGFTKTKSRALKIYGDLKKVKQPISPGGRLATFLNSLFTAGSPKKAKIFSSSSVAGGDDERKTKSAQASTCSSASSFSRSCLSNTPSSRGKLSNGMKRSVRFYPVSVIVDEDSRPCGQKRIYEEDPNLMAALTAIRKKGEAPLCNEELKSHLMEKNRRVEEAARDLLKGYQNKGDFDMRDLHREEDDDEEDEDDAASYSSSDLFELDNLSAIGMERYHEELPVYETTHLGTNRAIANGLIV